MDCFVTFTVKATVSGIVIFVHERFHVVLFALMEISRIHNLLSAAEMVCMNVSRPTILSCLNKIPQQPNYEFTEKLSKI